MTKERDLLRRADEICSRVWDPKAEELSEEIRTFLDTQKDERLTVGQISMMANERAKITSGLSGPVTTPCDIDPFPSEEA